MQVSIPHWRKLPPAGGNRSYKAEPQLCTVGKGGPPAGAAMLSPDKGNTGNLIGEMTVLSVALIKFPKSRKEEERYLFFPISEILLTAIPE